jgi:hypothetical protein
MDDLTLIEKFAHLHRGGALARCPIGGTVKPLTDSTDVARPADGGDYVDAVQGHLSGSGETLGVYPLFKHQNMWQVHWMAVDLDDGDASLIHARNVQALLFKFGIFGIVETSQSKGYHVWVYLKNPVSALLARRAMTGACRIVDAPTQEVYPKQTDLRSDQIGNCLRLPYPYGAATGRTCGIDDDDTPMELNDYINYAWIRTADPASIRQLLPLYADPEPAPAERSERTRTDDRFTGLAADIWEADTWVDRSRQLCTFALSLLGQGFTDDAVIELLYKLDNRMHKYADRSDRQVRIRSILEGAKREQLHQSGAIT